MVGGVSGGGSESGGITGIPMPAVNKLSSDGISHGEDRARGQGQYDQQPLGVVATAAAPAAAAAAAAAEGDAVSASANALLTMAGRR